MGQPGQVFAALFKARCLKWHRQHTMISGFRPPPEQSTHPAIAADAAIYSRAVTGCPLVPRAASGKPRQPRRKAARMIRKLAALRA
jgi:hypothetical protein